MKPIDLGLTIDDVNVPNVRGITRRMNRNDPKPPYEPDEVEGAIADVDTDELLRAIIENVDVWVGEEGDAINGTDLTESAYADDVDKCLEDGRKWIYIGRGGSPDRIEFRCPKTRKTIDGDDRAKKIGRREAKKIIRREYISELQERARMRI